MATAYVFTLYTAILHFLYGLSATDWSKPVERPPGDRTEIVQCSQPRIEIVRILYDAMRLPYGGHAQIVWWLCDNHVVLGIRVPNVYNFSFVIEMTPCFGPMSSTHNLACALHDAG